MDKKIVSIKSRESHVASVVTRLNRAEGQVAGVRRMIEADRQCVDVITQLNAVRAALDKVALELVDYSIENCSNDELDISQLLSRLMAK